MLQKRAIKKVKVQHKKYGLDEAKWEMIDQMWDQSDVGKQTFGGKMSSV